MFLAVWIPSGIALLRTGDLRAYLAAVTQISELPNIKHIAHGSAGQAHLYLGEVDQALDQLSLAVKAIPADNWFQGMAEANLFAATAFAGRHERAKALTSTVLPGLPAPGRRNIQGAFYGLDAFVTGLALMGERNELGRMYSLTLDYIGTGQVVAALVIGPSNPQLAAALAADAAGLTDRAREHFETAQRQAHEVPMRLLQTSACWKWSCTRAWPKSSCEQLRLSA